MFDWLKKSSGNSKAKRKSQRVPEHEFRPAKLPPRRPEPMPTAKSHVLYAYIGKPTTDKVGSFLRALRGRGVTITHLGKSDPPRKFSGSVEEAASMVFSGTDLTDYTFGRDAAHKLHFDIQIHHDPCWTHSTVSASCPDTAALILVAESASATFDSFITVRGVLGGGKEQAWEVVHITERCPDDLRSTFVAA